MVVTTTSAAALGRRVGGAGVDPADRAGALVLLTLLAGVLMIVAGVAAPRALHPLRLALGDARLPHRRRGQHHLRPARRPHRRRRRAAASALAKAIDVIAHPGGIDVPSLLVGLGRAGLIVVVLAPHPAGDRQRARRAGGARPSSCSCAGLDSVPRSTTAGRSRAGSRCRRCPTSACSVDLVAGAAAVAAIVLVQGAGVAEAAPNPDGRRRTPTGLHRPGRRQRAVGLFRGHAGRRLGRLRRRSTSRPAPGRRWAAIFSGLWMLIILRRLLRRRRQGAPCRRWPRS